MTPRAVIVIPTLDIKAAAEVGARAQKLAGVSCAVVIVGDHERRGGTIPTNAGYRAALDLDADYIVYLNDDVLIEQGGWLKRMIEVLDSNPRYGIACPAGDCRGGVQGTAKPGASQCVVEMDAPLAWFVAVLKREMLDQIGLFNAELAHYSADSDMTRRAQEYGWISVFVRDVWVDHRPAKPNEFWKDDRATYKRTWGKFGKRPTVQVFSNTLGREELRAAERAFGTRWLGKGHESDAFEAEFAEHLGVDGNVLLTDCCTSATYIALRALEIGADDEVIIPTVHFVAVANAVIDVGATPVFADVDEHTLNLLPSEVARLQTDKTRAVFLNHYGGHPANMAGIWAIINEGTLVLEDAANAVASTYFGQAVGTLGFAGVWSFDPAKELVMIDGGALWLRGQEAADRARSIRYLGMKPTTTSGVNSQAAGNDRWWEYDLATTSGRFINNDVHAAIGRVQLKRLPGFIATRRAIWETYNAELAGVGDLRLPPEPLPGCTSSYYMYWVQTDRRDELAAHLSKRGIYTTFRYYPLHQVKYYQSDAVLPNAERAAARTLNLPIHQNLGGASLQRVIDAVKEFYE